MRSSRTPTTPTRPARHRTGVADAVAELRASTGGRVVTAGRPGYDRARTVLYGAGRRPLAVVAAGNAADVAQTVRVARERGLELAVRGGGHSPAGHGTTDGGIVLDLSGMKTFHVDADRAGAWAGGGLTAGEYTAAASTYGMATGFGDTGSVGVGGITLSGGVGYLVRRHGLTIDNLLAADVVTADGELRRVDAATDPDLFWAIRGGGGNFGVATRLRYRLHPVDTVVGGTLLLPATARVLAAFLAEAEHSPGELTTIVNVVRAQGSLLIRATLVYAGGVRAGERVLAPFRALAAPITDAVRPTRYRAMLLPDGPHQAGVGRTMFLDGVDVDAAETILAQLHRSDSPLPVVQLRVLGGAMAHVSPDATAFAHRAPRVLANIAALGDEPDAFPARQAWADGFAAALRPGDGAAVGFLGDEGPARVRAAYPRRTWERLREVKRRYDPANLFRRNQNVPPAPEPTT